MGETTFRVPLSPQEWRLVAALREIPPSPLRDLLGDALQELVEAVREPRCPEAQADGFPCADVHAECEECRKLIRILEGLRARLQAA